MEAPVNSADDSQLMAAIVLRDRSAFSAFYDRHSPLVFAICLRVLRDRAAAEDALVDIFEEIWEKADRFSASRGSPVTYLITLSRSRAIDRLRSRPKDATSNPAMHDAAATGPSPLGQTLTEETRVVVVSALQQLEPDQREAIECSFYEGLSHSEIADKLNKPLGTVKSYIRMGLIQLRQSLRKHYGSAQ